MSERNGKQPTVDFGDRAIAIGTDHHLYAAILEGWPHWGNLQDHLTLGRVLMYVEPVTRVLRFTTERNVREDDVLDFYDLLQGHARAWADTYTWDFQTRELGDLAAVLSRHSRDRRASQHYTHADLSFRTPHGSAEFPGLSVADLRTLGEFLVGYADTMESDHRDDLA